MATAPGALLVTADGDIIEIDLPAAGRLAVMYAVLRCNFVDVIALTARWDMWIDDEGLYTQEPNPAATALARRFGHAQGQQLHGPVLITGGADSDGDTLPLTRDSLLGLLHTLADL